MGRPAGKRGRQDDDGSKGSPAAPGAREDVETADNLRFEDEFEDELEGDEVEEDTEKMTDGDNADGEGADDAGPHLDRRVYRPGVDKLEDGEELDFDSTAYTMLHRLTVEWPCLSFDVIRDNLGDDRSKFPLTSYVIAGTSAPRDRDNALLVMKWSDLHRTKNDDLEDEDDDSDNDSDVDDDAVVQTQRIKHWGGINRIRSMPQRPQIVSVWSEKGEVEIYDVSEHAAALDTPGKTVGDIKPLERFAHPEEGFGLDWSPVTEGRMLSGDCRKNIFLWEPREAGWTVDAVPYVGHRDSVEDLQWSPTEKNVFASCSVDKTIRIWDTRKKSKSAITINNAHEDDINVITWNSTVSYLVASGCDDGSFRVWDIRKWGQKLKDEEKSRPSAHFKEHKGPVTSIEWHPKDPSVLAVSSADDTVTVWDMSLEDDPDAVAAAQRANPQPDLQGQELPPQLMFVHQGQKEIKEIHWHPQLTSCLLSTASSGFNIFKPSNL